jgi:hypothetical protein
MRDGLKPVRTGLCVGGPLDGQIRSAGLTHVAFETYVVARTEAAPPMLLELLDPEFRLIRIAVSARAYRAIKATLRAGSVVYPPERNDQENAKNARAEVASGLARCQAQEAKALNGPPALRASPVARRPYRASGLVQGSNLPVCRTVR